jgi:hypothetical protein
VTPVENTADGRPTPPASRDAVDPELLALPAPPKARRTATLVLMALVVVGALGLALSVRHDLAYFFSNAETIDLGDAQTLDASRLEGNTQVSIHGTPMMSHAVHYRRVLTGSRHIVFPLAGQRTVYVQVEDREGALGRGEFTGRLVKFSQTGGRMGAVRDYLSESMDLPVSGESYLLLADETPSSYTWSVLLALLCALFIILDVLLLLRWFRPLPKEPEGTVPAE